MTCSELWRLILGVLETERAEDTVTENQGPENADPEEPDIGERPVWKPDGAEYADRYLGALETAVRMLAPLGLRYDPERTDPDFAALTEGNDFPLPPRFIPAAVYLTGYLLGGNTRLYELYTRECEEIKKEIPTEISPTVQAYGV